MICDSCRHADSVSGFPDGQDMFVCLKEGDPRIPNVHVRKSKLKPFLYQVRINDVLVNADRITILPSIGEQKSYGHKKIPLFLINAGLTEWQSLEGGAVE